jgi:GNAT superfamily N-acetyltransferase
MAHTPPLLEVEQNGYTISTDPARLDFGMIHSFLRESYWSPGIPRSVVERAAQNSLCFGVYHDSKQVGYSRIISDYVTFAYLADVFILPEHRGRGLSKWMVATVKSHPSLQGIRRWLLFTADAHGLYAQFGFVADPAAAERLMTWRDPAYEELVAKLDGKEA